MDSCYLHDHIAGDHIHIGLTYVRLWNHNRSTALKRSVIYYLEREGQRSKTCSIGPLLLQWGETVCPPEWLNEIFDI